MDSEFMASCDAATGQRLVLLPGSRTQEVRRNTEWLVQSASQVLREHPNTTVAIACFRESHVETVRQHLAAFQLEAEVHVGKTPELIATADACILSYPVQLSST